MFRHCRLLVFALVTFALIPSNLFQSVQAVVVAQPALAATNTASNANFTRIWPEIVGSIGGSVNTVVVKGSYAYISQGNALRVLDVSNPAAPTHISYITLPAPGTQLFVAENLLFIVGTGDMQIIDISDPIHPTPRGVYHSPGDVYSLHVVGNLAYVVDYGIGLQIVDVSNPAQPVLLGSYDTSRKVRAVHVVDNLAYVADEEMGLQIIDVLNPAQPRLRASITVSGLAVDVHVVNKIAYVAVGATQKDSGGLYLIDVSNLAAPKVRSVYNKAPIGGASAVQVVGSIAYADVGGVINIVDVSNPDAPSVLYVYGGGGRFHVENNILYIAGLQSYGLSVWDIRVPSNPIGLNAFETPGLPVDVQVVNTIGYVADAGGSLWTLDFSTPSQPQVLGRYRFIYGARDVEVVGTLAYVIADDKLNIINVSDPANLVLLDSYPVSGRAHNVAVVDGGAYVSAGWDGLQILDVRDPSNIGAYAHYTAADEVKDVQVVAGRAYLAAGLDGLQILDVTNPSVPSLLGVYKQSNRSMMDVDVVGTRAYLMVEGVGLQIIDVSTPQLPVLVGQYHGAGKLSVVGDLAYLAKYNQITIVDISDQASPTARGVYIGAGYAQTVYGANNLVYVAAESQGIHLLKLTTMEHARFLPVGWR